MDLYITDIVHYESLCLSSISHGDENYFLWLFGTGISNAILIDVKIFFANYNTNTFSSLRNVGYICKFMVWT